MLVCKRVTFSRVTTVAVAIAAMTATVALAGEEPSPYVGFQDREIKALSATEIEGLLAGHGMGLALAAELNRHPGPKHVLELADQLELTTDQRRLTEAAFDVMHAAAVALGRQVIASEGAIDELFASGNADEARLAKLVEEAAALRGRLRLAHLAAHLEMMRILSDGQVARYSMLRGYVDHANPPADCPHKSSGTGH